jgi:hypothetical protein
MVIERHELETRFNQLLTLAGRLPQGKSEDYVRRCVCEVIEAEGANRPVTVVTLISGIAKLKDAPDNNHVVTALCDVATTMLPTFASATARETDELTVRRNRRMAAIGIATIAVAGTTFWLL